MLSTIGIFIDVIIVAVLVIMGLIGFKKGFLKSVISLFSWSVCLIVAILLAKYVAGWINGIFDFSGLIGNKIADSLSSSNEYFNLAISSFGGKENIIAQIPESTGGLMKQAIKLVFSKGNVDLTSNESVSTVVGANLGQICMVIISGILIFIVLKIAIAILSKLFDNIARTKVLGGLNKTLGLVFGLLRAGLIIVVLNLVVIGLSLIPAVNKTITPLVQDNTYVEKVIYNFTDDFVEKNIIDGNLIQSWLTKK